jgi:hypothetical protein
MALRTLERMQARNLGGIYAPREFETLWGNWNIEADTGWEISISLMFAKLWPAPQQPKRIETVWRELEGARVFEDGRFFVKRTERSVSSFAWGSRVMGLTLPFALDSIINPADHSYVGLAKEWNAEPNQPAGVRASLGLSGAIRSDPITLHTVMTTAESGAISMARTCSHSQLYPQASRFTWSSSPEVSLPTAE